jgi:hypothetical protein
LREGGAIHGPWALSLVRYGVGNLPVCLLLTEYIQFSQYDSDYASIDIDPF